MKKEIEQELIKIKEKIADALKSLGLEEKESELDLLVEESEKPSFWDDKEEAQETLKKINDLKSVIEPWRKIETDATNLLEFLNEAGEDEELLNDAKNQLEKIKTELNKHEVETYFSGKYDSLNAVFSVYAGAGGVDAQDWAEMLLSMLLKYCEKHNLKATVIQLSPGTEAGLKSVSVEVSGPNAYGLLKSERGVHRLVRISPYDADKARHTSFALVEVIPEIEAKDLDIPESDLKIDTFRASGHGGQSVNTTDSAVRVTHIPTGITVSVQNERSQLQNRQTALKILKSRIYAEEEAKRDKELKVIRGENMANEWGSQIRSYVIHPYQKVKDHRTGIETSDTQGVLGGDLDKFVEGYLKS